MTGYTKKVGLYKLSQCASDVVESFFSSIHKVCRLGAVLSFIYVWSRLPYIFVNMLYSSIDINTVIKRGKK